MQIKIFLRPETPVFLPFSYYYNLSCAIYTLIRNADASFADMVHSGTEYESRIKLWGFSPLHSYKTEVHPEKSQGDYSGGLLFKGVTSFKVCSPWPQLLERLGAGFSKAEALRIGSQVFSVQGAEHLKTPLFNRQMVWQPVKTGGIVTAWTPKTQTRKQYLMPGDAFHGETAETILTQNIIHKWQRFSEVCPDIAQAWQEGKGLATEGEQLSESVAVEILPASRNKPFFNKAHKIKQAYVRSWSAPVRVTAPPPLQRLIWATGLGQMNTMGFGLVKEVGS